ncbi:MAG: DUF4255 domain-containing protein [Anaerolineales bacterium]|nr:DUF4255 domain-containing protein [Anaerolineales bacterium]
MIADLDKTITNLIEQEVPIDNGEIDVKFDQPKSDWSSKLSKPTINFFLYDIRENHVLRQHQWERIKKNGRQDITRQKRTPFLVDCHYVLTTWANEPEDEHRLMTRCLLALFRNPVIPESYLEDSLKDQPYPIQAKLAQHDKLTNPAELWSALDNELRPSVSLMITLALDPWEEVTGPPVRSMLLRAGQSEHPQKEELIPNAQTMERVFIGGQLLSGDQPQAGYVVQIEGEGLRVQTDNVGQFKIGAIRPGAYQLITLSPTGEKQTFPINVPGEQYEFQV